MLEVAGTTSMKLSHGFTRPLPSVLGTALIALIGIGWFKEPVTLTKVVSLVFIVVGVLGLNAGVREN